MKGGREHPHFTRLRHRWGRSPRRRQFQNAKGPPPPMQGEGKGAEAEKKPSGQHSDSEGVLTTISIVTWNPQKRQFWGPTQTSPIRNGGGGRGREEGRSASTRPPSWWC